MPIREQLERAKDVAMPQAPFDAIQIGGDPVKWECQRSRPQCLPELLEDRQAQRHMEPVQHLLSLWTELELEITHIVAAIGEEGDGLVHRQPLAVQDLDQPAARLRSIAGDE